MKGNEFTGDGARRWFAVRCRPGREPTVLRELECQGFAVYLPQELKLIRHARKMEKVPRPFFPGYLFLHLAPAERRWTAIRSTPGTVCAIHFGEYYPPIPDAVIASLKSLEDADGFILRGGDPVSPFSPGERIVIWDGNLSGIEGIFVCRNGGERALVLLDILWRKVKARLPLTLLKAA